METSSNDQNTLLLATNDDGTIFRTTSAVLAVAYIFLMAYQRIDQDKFPSKRFDAKRTTVVIHIIIGSLIVFLGCFFHIQNEVKPVLKNNDTSLPYRVCLYYTMGSMSCIHTITVFCMAPYVMGEKRITIPLYIGAGLVNLHNGIMLLCNPNLPNAFFLWGSVNTFLYQRAILAPMMFSNLDWELAYTYSLLAGASVSYSLSSQPQYVYLLLLLPILYGPFHEKGAQWFDIPLEDTLAGNKPSAKNITDTTKRLRGRIVSMSSYLKNVPNKVGLTNKELDQFYDNCRTMVSSSNEHESRSSGKDSTTKIYDICEKEETTEKMNWMKNASVGRDVVFVEATTVSHVQEIVKDTTNFPSPIRPAGNILSPTSICSNDRGTTISTLKLNTIHGIKYVQVPKHHGQAGELIPCLYVDCGTTLRDAQLYALEHSYELPFAGENGMATVGGSSFAVVKDSAIGSPPVKGMGLGDVASMIWSVDVVEGDGRLKTYCVMVDSVDEDGENNKDQSDDNTKLLFNKRFQGLLDSYGTQGIAVRMLLTLRPITPTTTTLSISPFHKENNPSYAQECATFLWNKWKNANDRNGNILGLIQLRLTNSSTKKNTKNTKKGYILIEERIPTAKAKHKTFAPFSFLLDPFYHWLKRIVIQRGWSFSWIYYLYPLSNTFALRFNRKKYGRRPGNIYASDIPLSKEKIAFTFASFPMNELNFKEVATSILGFIQHYEQNYNGFTPQCIALYVIQISGQRLAGPFVNDDSHESSPSSFNNTGHQASSNYRFCFDPIYNDPNSEEWKKFLIAFNHFAKEQGGRPSLNQTPMLEHDTVYGATAISYSKEYTSSRFVSPWLKQFLDSKAEEIV